MSKATRSTKMKWMRSPIFDDDAFDKTDVVSKHSIVGGDVYPLLMDVLVASPSGASPSGASPSGKQVVSSSMFIFPDRAKINKVSYVNHINGYLLGFEKCMSIMHHTAPGWTYRLYVDYSVYKNYSQQTEKDAYDAAETVKATLERIVSAHFDKGILEVYGVRSKETNNSFMPSIWRYLPMLDPSVDLMCPVDMDQPVSELIMHFCETWRSDPTNTCNLLFLQMDMHVPQQCALYLATNMEEADDGICPIAQCWFWRRMKTTEPGAPRKVFEQLFGLCNDRRIRDFFENMEIEWVLDEVRKAVVKSEAFSKFAVNAYTPRETIEILSDAVRVALTPPSSRSRSRSSIHQRREVWKKEVLADKRLIEFVALIVAGHVVGDAYGRVGNEVMKKMSDQMNMPNVNLMSDIVLKHGYGIDEWLLHVIMRTPEGSTGCASIMTPSSPSIGVNSRTRMILMSTDGAPPIVDWVHDVIDVSCAPNESHYGRLTLTEYMLRACVMLRMLSPDKGSNKDVVARWEHVCDDYLERIERCVGPENRPTLRRGVRALLNNEGFIVNGCIRRLFTITASLLKPWLESYGAAYDQKRMRTRFGSTEGFDAFKEVMTRACFLDLRFFNLDKYHPLSVYEGRKLKW